MATSPQAVSAFLRRKGWTPTPRSREGVHVTQSLNGATIAVDFNSDRRSREEVPFLRQALEEGGYIVRVTPDAPTVLFVSKED